MAKVLAHELEPYKLMFMEEVVLPENEEGFREVANQVSTPAGYRRTFGQPLAVQEPLP